MSLTLEEIHAEALHLSDHSRAELVERLLATLAEHPDPEVELAWFQEAERRRKQMVDGVVQGIPAEEVFARLSLEAPMRSVRFHPGAEDDLSEAMDRYNEQKAGLGASLLQEVRDAVSLVLQYPEMAPRVYDALRRKLLDRFPYSLLYSVEDDAVFVLAVAHHKRHPTYWLGRLNTR